ncbi:mRNA-binding ribosome synthesis protein nop7 [Pichia californica]|uniref:Pescadillo homolog n=1 Tax=Pichia californica TaxID=460514 RepID=A0A9P6WHE2_9ASCO|nr:mRNA-binding ribosome synthesis protein nop7 [[Candida] californica]KAG0687234.1 mRNA-binding ribosome synthesis protein nop7 [[Candida] californica]
MGPIKKKGESGNAKNFITRTRAIRKLQVSLADFRRLCIFKGIYPREPRNKKKANKGSTAPVTFYYTKDIQYLMHEPILQKFREHKTFSKKLTKALGKGEIGDAKRLEENRPKYKLDRVIKERYPSFLDALRDIDDALNMMFLFANMPATSAVGAKITKQANKLTNQWLAYVAKERSLKKVFVSIKGVYYSANIKGQEVRWLVPFKFAQNIPSDIDFKIMHTFLEFYSTLLHFVLYKLYTDAELAYPPKINENRLKGIGGLSVYILETNEQRSLALPTEITNEDEDNVKETKISNEEISKAIAADKKESVLESKEAEEEREEEAEIENVENTDLDEFKDSNKNTGDILEQPSKYANEVSQLFGKFIFFIGREVPVDILEFVILSAGGKVISEAAIDELENSKSIDLSSVTHQIVDRPKILKKVQGRTYIQPQWVFDCVNKSALLNVSDYAPGETLPPHLSPWGDAGTYDPEAPLEEAEDEEEEDAEEDQEEEIEADENDEIDDEVTAEDKQALREQKELELEMSGVKYSSLEKSDDKKIGNKRKHNDVSGKDEDDEKNLKMIMMSNKQRKLYKKMQYGLNKQDTRKAELEKKRKLLAKKKQELSKI